MGFMYPWILLANTPMYLIVGERFFEKIFTLRQLSEPPPYGLNDAFVFLQTIIKPLSTVVRHLSAVSNLLPEALMIGFY